jgi:hypothetical protein
VTTPAEAAGRDATVTLTTPIRPLLRWVNVVLFAVSERLPSVTGLGAVETVHFTRWSIVTRPPYDGASQACRRLRRPYLLWESDYNGLLEPYVESFVRKIGRQIQVTWGTTHAFPGTRSVQELLDYITAFQLPRAHYYTAYPGATVRMVLSGLEVAKEHRYLAEAAQTASPEEFAVVYRGFLRRCQGHL